MMSKSRISLMLIGVFMIAIIAQQMAVRGEDAMAFKAAPEIKALPGDPYTLGFDPVTGEKFPASGAPVIATIQGREFRFASKENQKKFEQNPTPFIEKVDTAIIKQQGLLYPLDKCMVSGQKINGSMGKGHDFVYKNRLVRFCCSGCVKNFQKDPEKFINQLNLAAIEKQKAGYPLTKCVVSGDALGGAMGKPVEYVIGNRLVRLCCTACVSDLRKNPTKYLAMIDAATAKKAHGDASSAPTK